MDVLFNLLFLRLSNIRSLFATLKNTKSSRKTEYLPSPYSQTHLEVDEEMQARVRGCTTWLRQRSSTAGRLHPHRERESTGPLGCHI